MVFDFRDSRGGHHARDFLSLDTDAPWQGRLVCDDFSGYKALFARNITEAECLAPT